MAKTPNIYIISGPNGAGKTTASYTILPEVLECDEFVNADEIAKGLSPFKPEEVAIEAGRLMLSRIRTLMSQRRSFAIETTLATRSYRNLIREAHGLGYHVTLLFFWLSSAELAVDRVRQRVAQGGHNIPKNVIYRCYASGIKNLFDIYIPIVDAWFIYDNSEGHASPIADGEHIANAELFKILLKHE